MRILKLLLVVLLIVPRLVFSQTYLEIPPLKEVVIIPTELNQIKGKFLDNPTFDYTGFKLSLAVGCENQLIQEKEFRVQVEKQRDKAQTELGSAQSDFKNAVENARIKSDAQEIIIQGLNDEIKSNQTKYLKSKLRFGTIALVAVLSVWGLTRAGVL